MSDEAMAVYAPRRHRAAILLSAAVLLLAVAAALIARPAAADESSDGAHSPRASGESRPAILFVKSYSTYLTQTRPVLQQWWGALEGFFGHHRILQPTASDTENAAEVSTLLEQWQDGIESFRGGHFLLNPIPADTDSTLELHELLNQWQNAMEAWRGFHWLLEPPSPLTSATVRTTGVFALTPKRAMVESGEAFSYEIDWKVPRPQNWHDLRTIDLRVCGKDPMLWIRWRELTGTLSLLNPKNGKQVAMGRVGAKRSLVTPAAVLDLAGSSVTGNGETGRRVTLELDLTFRPSAAGSTCRVQLAAKDDLRHSDGFKRAGTLEVAG